MWEMVVFYPKKKHCKAKQRELQCKARGNGMQSKMHCNTKQRIGAKESKRGTAVQSEEKQRGVAVQNEVTLQCKAKGHCSAKQSKGHCNAKQRVYAK